MHTVDISSTTYLPTLVNIVCGRPLSRLLGCPSPSAFFKTKLVMDQLLLLGRDIEISNKLCNI